MVQHLRASAAAVVGGSPPTEPILVTVLVIIALVAAVITALSPDRGSGGEGESRANAGGPGEAAGAGREGDIEEGLNVYRPIGAVPIDAPDDPPDLPPPEAGKKKKASKSIAHAHFEGKSLVHFHLDVEDGGPQCGIVQLSVVAMNADLQTIGEFDRYVRPPSNAVWAEKTCAVHGLSREDPRIAGANDIVYVWREFHNFIERNIPDGKVGMLVAWNGRGSDMTKLFQVTEILYRGVLEMPKGLQFFCDPMMTIKHYTKCALYETRRPSKREGYGLDVVYREAFGRRIKDDFEGGAHNSLNDARAQAKIFADERVFPFIDLPFSIVTMNNVWKGKYRQMAEQAEEPKRQVPPGYTDTNLRTFEVPPSKRYTGARGGGVMGPSATVTDACNSRKLSDLFRYYITPEMLRDIATETNRYANGTWVRKVSKEEYFGWKADEASGSEAEDETPRRRSLRKPKKKKARQTREVEIDLSGMTLGEAPRGEQKEEDAPGACEASSLDSTDSHYSLDLEAMSVNSDGSYDHLSDDEAASDDENELERADYVEERKQRERLVECTADHKDARKRYQGSQDWVDVTEGQLMAFYGILCIRGALGLRTWRSLYEEEEGFNSTFVQNADPAQSVSISVRGEFSSTFLQSRPHLVIAKCKPGRARPPSPSMHTSIIVY